MVAADCTLDWTASDSVGDRFYINLRTRADSRPFFTHTERVWVITTLKTSFTLTFRLEQTLGLSLHIQRGFGLSLLVVTHYDMTPLVLSYI